MTKILITGATGFLGGFLLESLQKQGVDVIGTTRKLADNKQLIATGDLSEEIDWSTALQNKDVVIHCAGLAHISPKNPHDFYRINVQATKRLLEQCIVAGVKQFIFISSIGVNGNITKDKPFTANDTPNPVNIYTKSKAEAEKCIKECVVGTDMSYTIIRPPLVYGRGARGSFGTLVKIMDKKIPLPLAGVDNRRSVIGIENLADLVFQCVLNLAAYNQTFLVSDGIDVSTETLLRKIEAISGTSIFLFPFPKRLIGCMATLVGREATYRGLFESLQVDITATNDRLNWEPPLTLDEGLANCFNQGGE